jgi:hypothetical protein
LLAFYIVAIDASANLPSNYLLFYWFLWALSASNNVHDAVFFAGEGRFVSDVISLGFLLGIVRGREKVIL